MGYIIEDVIGTVENAGGINLFDSIQSTKCATQTQKGLMSADDKVKLDGIEPGANKYIHPKSGIAAGTYGRVVVSDEGHVTAGNAIVNGTLAEFGITDAYIEGHKIRLGNVVIEVLTPEDELSVKWINVINRPFNTIGDGLYVNAHGVLSIAPEENDCLWEYDGLDIMPRSDSGISTIVDALWMYDGDGNLTTHSSGNIGEAICSKWKLDGFGNVMPRLIEYGVVDRTKILAEDDYEDKFIIPAGAIQSTFTLTKKPYAGIRMTVNGVRYYDDCFTYNKSTNAITWTYTAASGGFDITDSEVIFCYDPIPE